MTAPVAFLSHSWENSQVATRLATDLRSHGVDVWLDEWEIKPGDSLRRKIDEGIEKASFFLVLLTPESLRSEWVQVELDAGMVKRIAGQCRLIPILLGIGNNLVPPTLRGILWVRLDDYEAGLRRLLEVCHGVETKPSVGTPPRWTAEKPLEGIDLSTRAQRLATLLCERSETGVPGDPTIPADEVVRQLEVTEDEIALAADELEERLLAKLFRTIGQGKAGFKDIASTDQLFFRVDPYVKGSNPQEDAKTPGHSNGKYRKRSNFLA